MKYLSVIIILLLFCFPSWSQVFWQRAVTNYSKQQYLSGNQNWQVSQLGNGWMYFANNKGLLEFDGVYWNTYPLQHEAKARAVEAVGGRVYVGGLGQFGFFEPNIYGQLQYHDLSPKEKSASVINIWNIHLLDDRVVFQGDDGVYVYYKGHIRHIRCERGISYSNVIYGRLYAVSRDGIYLLVGNRFELIPHTKEITHEKIISLLPFHGRLLAVTSHHGLFVSSGGNFLPYHSPTDVLLQGKQLSCADINSSHLALGTLQDGVILQNLKTGNVSRISTHNGLQNKTVLSLLFDRENNLWLGLDNGIDCISFNAHLFFLDSRLSPVGSGYASALYDGVFYLGTNQGVYATSSPLDINREVSTTFMKGTDGQSLGMSVYDDRLFCGGRNYFVMINHGHLTSFPLRGVWNIMPSHRQPHILYLGTYWGLYVMKKQGGEWRLIGKVKGVGLSAKTMLVERATDAIWIANKEKGLYRIKLSDDHKTVLQAKCYNSKLLPKGNNVSMAEINNQIVVASRQGLFRYHYAADRLERYVTLENMLGGSQPYTYIHQDSKRNIWYASQGMMHVLHYDAIHHRYYRNQGEVYLAGNLMDDFESICELAGDRYVFGTENGYAMLHMIGHYNQQERPEVQVRYIWARGFRDSLVYAHSIAGTNRKLILPYRDNSIKIEYSASNYDRSQTVLYAYRLEGPKSEPWSVYTTSHSKEYTDLPGGHYVFHVRVITTRSSKPIVTQVAFDVLPPWYLTWWARLSCLFLVGLFVWLLIRRYRQKQRQLITEGLQKLEQQQKRFEAESSVKDQKIEDLENEKIKIELRSKSEELIRSRMNVVRKNEMLQEIKKTVVSISNAINEDNLPSIRRKVIRLMGQIDTNIEHDDDMEAFQTSFDAVHHDFLSLLRQRFPNLTHKEEMLCIYIRMNLMSKEIAPLLNISLRGVEISRYRLRKKLKLKEGTSLGDFLQQITNDSESV